MHFLREACKRKPLESKGIAYSRATTAICMCCLFLAYIGFLINQLYNDTPLIVLSSEQMGDDYPTPDAEFCVGGSTLTINNCYYSNKTWDRTVISDCNNYFVAENLKRNPKCYMFMPNDTFHMYSSDNSKNNSVRSFEFYWTIDDVKSFSKLVISVPTVSIQIYDPRFSPRRPGTIGNSPKEKQVAMYLGQLSQRASSSLNLSSTIFYAPQKYYEIRPFDFRAFLGLKPDYIEINTMKIQESSWAISNNPPPNSPKNPYQGQISIELAQNTIDIQKETRQHTLLASVSLAGGSYGLLTAIYVLLFGMNKLTPWGLIHNTSSMINKVRYTKIENERDLENNGGIAGLYSNKSSDCNNNFNSVHKNENENSKLFSWIPTMNSLRKSQMRKYSSEQLFYESSSTGNNDDSQSRRRPDSSSNSNLVDENDEVILESVPRKSAGSTINSQTIPVKSQRQSLFIQYDEKNKPEIITKRSSYFSEDDTDFDDQEGPGLAINPLNLSSTPRSEQNRIRELESRVNELEAILSQFFLDTTYINVLRSKAERSKASETKRKSMPIEMNAREI